MQEIGYNMKQLINCLFEGLQKYLTKQASFDDLLKLKHFMVLL